MSVAPRFACTGGLFGASRLTAPRTPADPRGKAARVLRCTGGLFGARRLTAPRTPADPRGKAARVLLLVASAVVVLAPAAAAQPGVAAGSDPAVVSAPASGGEPAFARPALVTRHREESAGGRQSSRTHAVLFWFGFAGAVVGAGVAVASRTPMRSVLGLLGVVLSTAGLYLLLRAELLAAIQVIVYAGAVVVLFAFVIMFLQQGALPPPGERWLPVRLVAAVALAWLFYLAAPELAEMGRGTRTPLPAGFGTTAGLGDALFTTYLVPFEALSMLLLAAIVGAVAVARGGGAAGRRGRRAGS